MKLAITAGGGGHFSPALSVIQSLPEETEAFLIGRKYAFEGDKAVSFEYQTAADLAIPFFPITTARFQRTITRRTLPSLVKLPYGLSQALKILKHEKPDVVLSFGGYVAVPVTLAAKMLGIPVVLHEQTMEIGLANKIAAFTAKYICISWKSSEKYFPKEKTVLTGNPIKQFQISNFKFQISNESLPFVYITGGSSGSHAINTLVLHSLEELLMSFKIIHQTGDSHVYEDYDALCKKRKTLPENLQKRYAIEKFIPAKDVGGVLETVDVVVSRAGISTVTELFYFQKPSFLIPLPSAQKNEQMKNALFLKDVGLADVHPQETLNSKTFCELLQSFISKRDRYKIKKSDIVPNSKVAAEKIIEIVYAAQKTKKT